MAHAFETLNPAQLLHSLQQGHTSKFHPNISTNRGPNIQIYEPMGTILLQVINVVYLREDSGDLINHFEVLETLLLDLVCWMWPSGIGSEQE